MVTLVEGDPKTPFSIATTLRCRGGRYSITLDPYLIMLSVKPGGIKYQFWVFVMTRPGIEPRSLRLVANTLLFRRMARFCNVNDLLIWIFLSWSLNNKNKSLQLFNIRVKLLWVRQFDISFFFFWSSKFGGLIFNGMSIRPRLFYTNRLTHHVYYSFISTFPIRLFLKNFFFIWSYRISRTGDSSFSFVFV